MSAANSINPYPPAIAPDANTTAVRDGSGNINAAGFSGSGAGLTGLPAPTLQQVTDAGNITTDIVSFGGSASYGAMTLIGNVVSGDAAGLALFNQGGGSDASVSIGFFTTPYNNNTPQAQIKGIDDGDFSNHLLLLTKQPGSLGAGPLREVARITSDEKMGILNTAPAYALDIGADANVSGVWRVAGVQVVGPQQAAIADSTGSGDVVAQLNSALAALRAHGLIAT